MNQLKQKLKYKSQNSSQKERKLFPIIKTSHIDIVHFDTLGISNEKPSKRSQSLRRNQVRTIRRAKLIGYSQLIENYKSQNRKVVSNPFYEDLKICKAFNLEQYQEKIDQEDLKGKFSTIQANRNVNNQITHNISISPKAQRISKISTENLETDIQIYPYIASRRNNKPKHISQNIDFIYIM